MPEDSNKTFRDYVQAAHDEIEPRACDCATDSEWFLYHRGQLPARRQEQLQAHLVQCAACREALLDAAAFSAPDDEATPDLDSEWAALRERIAPPRVQPRRVPWLAAAASLLLAVGIGATWIWRIQQKLDAERMSVARLEQQVRELRRMERPHSNLRLFDAFPSGSVTRSTSADPISRVSVRAGEPFALILSAAGQPEFPPYTLQLLDVSGSVVWEDTNASRDANGNFVVEFPRGFATIGEYRIELSGRVGANHRKLARYAISYRATPVTEKPAQK